MLSVVCHLPTEEGYRPQEGARHFLNSIKSVNLLRGHEPVEMIENDICLRYKMKLLMKKINAFIQVVS